ncbi:hypothetical protein O7623_25565 [Solwaraspora sp. WMMD791]|uniref:hypothetical protein n=1 Tax=Solwaraspora sp. WMMD791 TaxID=3016086 RepID=UPI00249C31E8|nr:hypothetical protein [Solwaraspora sp. WMMD791]WFE26631.1 hypothetical protein O7623_25565 [Solwaraspora sp. WMMD791]
MRMQDLVDLATSESPPPRYSVDDIVESGRRAQRRRRFGWLTAAATPAAAGVAAAVMAPSLLGGASPPVTGDPVGEAAGAAQAAAVPGPPFTYTFTGYRVGKLRVADPVIVSTAYQLTRVYADGMTTNDMSEKGDSGLNPWRDEPSLHAYLTVYRPGAYDPTTLVDAQSVTVAGRPGLELNRRWLNWAAYRTLAWEYAENAWAVIDSMSDNASMPSAEDLRDLAAGWRPAPPTPATVPITMDYVPPGYSLDEAAMHTMTGLNGIASARNGDYAGLLFSSPAQPTTGLTEPYGTGLDEGPPGSFFIYVGPAENSNQKPSPGITCLVGFCNRWYADDSVNVQVASSGRLSNAEMTKILDGISVGNVHDDSTWIEVGTAVP